MTEAERHRRRGLAAKGAGRRVEELIGWANKRLAQEGRAWIVKTNPPVGGRVGRKGTTWYAGGGPPDYIGFLSGGRGVCFDLKSTLDARWEWKVRRGSDPREAFRHARTKERQIADLEGAGKFGALAGLLVVLSSASQDREALWVPWPYVRRISEGRWNPVLLVEAAGAARVEWHASADPLWIEAALRSDSVAQLTGAVHAAKAFRRTFPP